MATTFTSIYDKFVPMITDATLLVDGSLDEDLLGHCLGLATTITLFGATSEFRVKLDTIDTTVKEFTTDLTIQEQYIVASAMRLHWIEPFINDTDYLMTATGGTRDYSEGSHANLLEKMSTIKANYESETDGMLIAYGMDNDSLLALS